MATPRTDVYTPADIGTFLHKLGYDRASIGGYVFYINPQKYEVDTLRIHKEQPTLGGVIRFGFGVMSYTYTISGWTGNAGLQDLTSQQGIGNFRPTFEHAIDQWYYFSYPARGLVNRKVYIDSVRDWQDDTIYQGYQYEIIMQEFPVRVPSYTTVMAANAPKPVG